MFDQEERKGMKRLRCVDGWARAGGQATRERDRDDRTSDERESRKEMSRRRKEGKTTRHTRGEDVGRIGNAIKTRLSG